MPRTRYPGLIEFVKSEIIKGTSTRDLYVKAVDEFGYEEDLPLFYNYVYKVKMRHMSDDEIPDEDSDYDEDYEYGDLEGIEVKGDTPEEQLLSILKKNQILHGEDVCNILGCSPSEIFDLISDLRKQGYEIICDESNIVLSSIKASDGKDIRKPLERRRIIFGVMSDLHFGSKYIQISAMHEFTRICKRRGVEHIFCPGDICAGYKVYPGQDFEVYAHGAAEQEESVIVNLPRGFEYYMLGGNHDYSYIKRSGHNPLLAIESKRPDIHYVGYDEADVPILPGVDVKMWHPSGGVPYAMSYRIQKQAETIMKNELACISMNVKQKPSIRFLLAGHLHIQMQAMFGSILGMQCGTFESQTPYLGRKGLYPAIGGWIVEANIKSSGLIGDFNAHFYMFDPIEDDYKNYNHYLDQKREKKAIFE